MKVIKRHFGDGISIADLTRETGIQYRIYRAKPQTFDEAKELVDEYIYFYNNERIQLKTGLTPMEVRCAYAA